MFERPRARRYPFAASIDLVDVHSEAEVQEQTTDLSIFGCHVTSLKPWPAGTKVRLRILHRGAVFTASGNVVNVGAGSGMNIVFSQVEEKDQAILEKWLDEAREKHERFTPVD